MKAPEQCHATVKLFPVLLAAGCDVMSLMPVTCCSCRQQAASAGSDTRHVQVVVFSWSRCPFCVKAKSALKSMDANFVAVELDQMPEGAAMRAELAKVCRVALTQYCPPLHVRPDCLRHATMRTTGMQCCASQ